jgi:hypothetical protein
MKPVRKASLSSVEDDALRIQSGMRVLIRGTVPAHVSEALAEQTVVFGGLPQSEVPPTPPDNFFVRPFLRRLCIEDLVFQSHMVSTYQRQPSSNPAVSDVAIFQASTNCSSVSEVPRSAG